MASEEKPRRHLIGWLGAIVIVLIIAATIAYRLWPWAGSTGGEADTQQMLALGQEVYAEECASCHGVNLEGEPNWRVRLENGRLPAPPHDVSGHTWHHPDEVLFGMTKYGPGKLAGLEDYESDMPAFEGLLSDQQIRAVLAYIKSTWPAEIRMRHEDINRRNQ